ncbi:hypothetical protein ANAPC2_01346 [Anaplasma phagocytophilum]|jgi:hypothetical protein|nr:hypothetical protein ANAPC2_01346 [Anaplasma phagocytophilum]
MNEQKNVTQTEVKKAISADGPQDQLLYLAEILLDSLYYLKSDLFRYFAFPAFLLFSAFPHWFSPFCNFLRKHFKVFLKMNNFAQFTHYFPLNLVDIILRCS